MPNPQKIELLNYHFSSRLTGNILSDMLNKLKANMGITQECALIWTMSIALERVHIKLYKVTKKQ